MAKTNTISIDLTLTFYIDETKAGQIWNFTAASSIKTTAHGIYVLESSNTRLDIAGDITSTGTTSGYSGIGCDSTNLSVTVEKTSVIASGTFGIFSKGLNSDIVNHGTISAPAAVRVDGDRFDLRNDGKLIGTSAVIATGDNAVITNLKAGQIIGSQFGVTLSTEADEVARFVNHGTVTSYMAIGGGNGKETIINDGKVNGHVSLQGGNDMLDDRGGTITGNIYGGKGNDTLYVSSILDRLIEFAKEGNDTVRSTVTYALDAQVENLYLLGKARIDGIGTDLANRLYGNAANNNLVGMAGNDLLDGNGGNDILRGGFGADTYVFSKGYGVDRIRGFEDESDKIDLSDWAGMKTFSAIKQHASDHGTDVWITSGQDTLIIEGFHKSNLDDSFFL